jgi:quercetin dioxygenase-like cupin family protein
MANNPLRNRLALAVGLVVLLLCGAVAYAATATILAVGTTPHSELIGGPATLTARRLVTPPGEVGAWHYHPGPVFNVVKSGAIVIEDGCGEAPTYVAGQAFENIGGRVHRAVNPFTESCVEYNMFINPQGTPLTVFIPNNQRQCGPARGVEECKADGWRNFDFPHSFVSQGDCVQFVLNGRGQKSVGSTGTKP